MGIFLKILIVIAAAIAAYELGRAVADWLWRQRGP